MTKAKNSRLRTGPQAEPAAGPTAGPAAEPAYECLRLENQLCFPLYACAKEVVRLYREPLQKLGLTYTQYLAMLVFWEYGGLSEKELGEKLYLDSGTLTPLLKRLEKQGLVIRRRLRDNERRLRVDLTEKGRELKHQAAAVPFRMRGCLALSDGEAVELALLLKKALAGME